MHRSVTAAAVTTIGALVLAVLLAIGVAAALPDRASAPGPQPAEPSSTATSPFVPPNK